MYEYRATVLRVIDGDTIRVRLDLGCDVRIDLTLRLAGIDTPELPTPEGFASRDWLLAKLIDPVQTPVIIRTVKDRREKYGRYLAYVRIGEDPSLNEQMVELGLARPYPV